MLPSNLFGRSAQPDKETHLNCHPTSISKPPQTTRKYPSFFFKVLGYAPMLASRDINNIQLHQEHTTQWTNILGLKPPAKHLYHGCQRSFDNRNIILLVLPKYIFLAIGLKQTSVSQRITLMIH